METTKEFGGGGGWGSAPRIVSVKGEELPFRILYWLWGHITVHNPNPNPEPY